MAEHHQVVVRVRCAGGWWHGREDAGEASGFDGPVDLAASRAVPVDIGEAAFAKGSAGEELGLANASLQSAESDQALDESDESFVLFEQFPGLFYQKYRLQAMQYHRNDMTYTGYLKPIFRVFL